MLLLAACGSSERSILREEYASSAQIDPAAPLTLGPDEGIVVGMAAFAHRNISALPLALERGIRKDLVLQHGNGQRWQLQLVPLGSEDLQIQDGDATMTLRPFAFRMPAGEVRYTLLADVIARGSVSSYSGGNMIGHAIIHGPRMQRLPPANFTVSAGRVTYVGRVGWMAQRVDFPNKEARDAACPPGQHVGGGWGGARPYACASTEFFIGEDAERDLPAIRAAFHAIARLESVIRPARSNNSQPRTWSRVLSHPQEGAGIHYPW